MNLTSPLTSYLYRGHNWDDMKTVKATLIVMGTVVTIIAGIISVVAYLQGGPEQVVQTFTVIVEAPAQVVNIDVSAIVDRLDKILALAEDFYDQ